MPFDFARLTESEYITCLCSWLRNQKAKRLERNELSFQLRKLGWGVISSLSEQKITMQQWWPIEGDAKPKKVSQKWVDKTHAKVVAIWGNEFKEDYKAN